MADIYVATNGSDANGNGSNANPYRTLTKARNEASSGDQVLAKNGIYYEAWKVKTGVRFKSLNKHGAIIDGGEHSGSDMVTGTGYNNFSIEGFVIRNAPRSWGGISTPQSYHATYRDNLIYNCDRPGIIVSRSDVFTIIGNEVYNCGRQTGLTSGSQGITVLHSADFPSVATPAGWGGFRIRILDNISHDNLATTGAETDNCGIIIDANNRLDKANYSGKTLIRGNICYGNGGPGFRVQESHSVTLQNNTSYDNMKDPRRITKFGSEFHDAMSSGNTYIANIGFAIRSANEHHAFQMTSPMRVAKNPAETTFTNNIFCGVGSAHVLRRQGIGESGFGKVPSSATNKIGVNPRFVNAGAHNFALQSNSPAIGYGTTGAWPDAGAVMSGTPAVEPDPLTALAAPTATFTPPAKSGGEFTFAAGTFAGGEGTLTVEHFLQVSTGPNAWANQLELVVGTNIFVTLAEARDARVVTIGTKGDEVVVNPSAVFLLSPADTTPEEPEEPGDPVDPEDVSPRILALEEAVAALVVAKDAAQADLADARHRIALLEARTTASDALGAAQAAQEAAAANAQQIEDISNTLSTIDRRLPPDPGDDEEVIYAEFAMVARRRTN